MVPLDTKKFIFSGLPKQTVGRHEPLKLMLVIAVITNGEKVLLIQRAPNIVQTVQIDLAHINRAFFHVAFYPSRS